MNNKMQAAIFKSQGKLVLEEVDIPKILKEDDVIIKVEAVSICGTDLHILAIPPNFEAKPGTILGHELSGTIIEVGRLVKDLKVGDKVVVDPNEYCGLCEYCKMGLTNLCLNIIPFGVTVDGGFSEYTKTASKVIHKIPDNLSFEVASLTEPLADVINATRKLCIQPWETVVIWGAGPIGQLFLKLLNLNGAFNIMLIEVSDYRTDLAIKNGAKMVINPNKENIEEIIYKETKIGADIVIDTVGSLFGDSINIVRKGGKILLFGCNTSHISNIKQFNLTYNEIQVISNFISGCFFPQAIKLNASGKLELGKMITHKFKLKEIHKGIELLQLGKALKVIINP